jgi:hypothetical protein
MKVEISNEVLDDPQLRSRVEQANQLLEEIIGPAAGSVTVKWSRDIPKGRWDFINLDIFDSTGARGTTPFAPGELTREDYLRARLYRVWGDLLQDRSHQQLNVLSGKIDAPLK